MPKLLSYPHRNLQIKDESNTTPLIVEELPLHRPMFISRAEKGEPGVPVWGSYTELAKKFGKGTFDVYGEYFNHQNVFLNEALKFQKAFFVRVAPADATVASLVLMCSVQVRTDIPVWEEVDGIRTTDEAGNWIQALEGGIGDPLVEEGVVITWSTRALAANEDPNTIAPVVTPDVNGAITKYPIAVFSYKSPCAAGNNSGFKMYWDSDSDESLATDMKALLFKIAPVEIPYGLDNPLAIYSRYITPDSEFTFKTGTIDPSTKKRYNLDEILHDDYTELPFDVVTYPANVELIGALCISKEDLVKFPELNDNLSGETFPFMVNIMTGKTLDGMSYYDHIVVGGPVTVFDSVTPNSNLINNEIIVQYLTGGSDGTINDAITETLVAEWLTGLVFPDIEDSARYPCTHLYDSGFVSDTKDALIDFLGIRDDIKVVISTQSVYDPPNTKSEDQSLGSYLRSRILLHPESYIYGTQACRGTIFQQCGKLTNGAGWNKTVPATIDSLIKRCMWQGATFMKGKPKGLPNSAVTVITDINWFPVTADFKQTSWDKALNYIQFYDMVSYHYADTIAVYPYQTSLLSDDIFVDMLLYIKHITRYQWSKFSGLDDPINKLIGDIRDSVSKDIYDKLGNFIRTEVNPYQTDLDAEQGYALTVEIAAYGTVPNRVWNVIVPVRREQPVA